MKKSTAIFSICISSDDVDNKGNIYEQYAKYSIPLIEEYSKFTKSDFILLDKPICKYHTCNKFMISDLLNEYERVLYIDVDFVVKKHSPNIFDEVPVDCLGIYQDSRRYNEKILEYFEKVPDCLPDNELDIVKKIVSQKTVLAKSAGLMVVPSIYKNCFRKPNKEVIVGPNRDQIWQNILFLVTNPKFYDLPAKWHYHRPYKTEQRYKNALDENNYFIHFTEDAYCGKHSKDYVGKFINELYGS